MLASALKFGTTRHLEPHPRQLEGDSKLGVPSLRWTEGDDLGNIQSLIDASIASFTSAVPEIKDARYDFETRTFRDAQGSPLSDEMLDGWISRSAGVRAAGAGRRSVKRGVFLNTLSRTESSERPGILGLALRFGRQLVAEGNLKDILY